MDESQLEALLTMHLTKGIGHGFVNKVGTAFEDYTKIFEISPSTLSANVPRLSVERAAKLLRDIKQTREQEEAQKELALIEKHRAKLIAIDDENYPQLLKHINDPPSLLWVKGELKEDDALALAIVGSRKCTHYGREQAARFACGAAQYGLCTVSGGAYGIDAAAHRAAIDSGGRTIAVIGSGLANPYPKDHVELFAKIVQEGANRGAVISELPMTTAPNAENFPRRNRIISGMSLGTLVVEAALRSGALITARLCAEDHGRELMVVPGRADSKTSAGCHKIIKEGWGKLVTGIADCLDSLGEAGQILKASQPDKSTNEEQQNNQNNEISIDKTLSENQRKIIESLAQAKTVHELSASTSLDIANLQADLTMLELRGKITRTGNKFVLKK